MADRSLTGGSGGFGRGVVEVELLGGRVVGAAEEDDMEKDKEWGPVTKLGRLVKDGKMRNIEDIYLLSRCK